jgi:hypothetical protein
MPRQYNFTGAGKRHVRVSDLSVQVKEDLSLQLAYTERVSVTADDGTVADTDATPQRFTVTLSGADLTADVPRISNARTGATNGVTNAQLAYQHVLSLVRADQLRRDAIADAPGP